MDKNEKKKISIKQFLINAGKVALVAGVAVVAGVISLASQDDEDDEITDCDYSSDMDEEIDEEVYGLGDGKYPSCKTCAAKMTKFDGWAWYTCPKCGDSVRIIEGKETWHDEIFKQGKKEFHSDFELADFCRGGDLTED